MTAITEPGLYPHLDNETYHEQTEWLSSSMLKARLPERFKATPPTTEALAFGTLLHAAVLEPDRLDDLYVALDPAAVGTKADGSAAANPTATASWKRAVAEVEADGKAVVTAAELARALAMRDAVYAHPTAEALLTAEGATTEESAFAAVDEIPCRARFDRRIPGAVLDVKTTVAKPGRDSIARAVLDHGYDLSAAHYLAVARALALDVEAFGLIFVGKADGAHYVTVADLDDAFLERGKALRALALDRHHGLVDAYEGAAGYLTLTCPRWAELETAS